MMDLVLDKEEVKTLPLFPANSSLSTFLWYHPISCFFSVTDSIYLLRIIPKYKDADRVRDVEICCLSVAMNNR